MPTASARPRALTAATLLATLFALASCKPHRPDRLEPALAPKLERFTLPRAKVASDATVEVGGLTGRRLFESHLDTNHTLLSVARGKESLLRVEVWSTAKGGLLAEVDRARPPIALRLSSSDGKSFTGTRDGQPLEPFVARPTPKMRPRPGEVEPKAPTALPRNGDELTPLLDALANQQGTLSPPRFMPTRPRAPAGFPTQPGAGEEGELAGPCAACYMKETNDFARCIVAAATPVLNPVAEAFCLNTFHSALEVCRVGASCCPVRCGSIACCLPGHKCVSEPKGLCCPNACDDLSCCPLDSACYMDAFQGVNQCCPRGHTQCKAKGRDGKICCSPPYNRCDTENGGCAATGRCGPCANAGEIQNPTTCECTCPPPKTRNNADGSCTCTFQACQGAQVQDPDSCACGCPESCTGGTLDPITCRCGCPTGKTLCGGQCVDYCTNGKSRDPANSCACDCDGAATSCNTAHGQGCPCQDTGCLWCPPGKRVVHSSCSCVDVCPAGMINDPQTGRCTCPGDTDPCGGGCVPKCGGGQIRDQSNCFCRCPSGQLACHGYCVSDCIGGQLLDNCACQCAVGMIVCQDRCVPACPSGQTMDSSVCVCRACPAGREGCGLDNCDHTPCTVGGQLLDPVSCLCECQKGSVQGSGCYWCATDPAGWACHCENSCPDGQQTHPNEEHTCVCRPPLGG